ncbi:MAG: hypothetical protein MUF54_19880 [Polyangiaceae bacterium]|jgi:hypothetical protein|nr:hypothetical protein [Polyangiaceae bacterium]
MLWVKCKAARAVAAVTCGAIGLLGLGCSDDDRPHALTGSQRPGGGGHSDASTLADAGDASTLADAGDDASTYTGPVATVTGTLFAMEPPSFPPIMTDEPSLGAPATLHAYSHGHDYVADYTPGDGFQLVGVPANVLLYAVGRDVGDGNGILPSSIGAWAKSGALWNVPVVKRSSLEEIYQAVTPPQSLDPSRAQVLVSIVTCRLQGGVPIPGVHIVAPATAGGVIYDSAGGWVFDRAGATGSLGMAIVVNLVAQPYPGVDTTITYKKGQGDVVDGLSYRPFQGGVARAALSDECL